MTRILNAFFELFGLWSLIAYALLMALLIVLLIPTLTAGAITKLAGPAVNDDTLQVNVSRLNITGRIGFSIFAILVNVVWVFWLGYQFYQAVL